MNKLILLLAVTLSFQVFEAQAGFTRSPTDLRFPNQEVFNKTVVTPGTSAVANILLDNAGGGAAAATVTTFLAQPDVARNLVITPTGTTADVAAGNVTVNGWSTTGQAISEDFAFLANASTSTVGVKAFAKIKSIVFPIEDSPFGATWSVGQGEKLGLTHCLDGSGWFYLGMVDNVALTGKTLTTSATAVESNTILTNPLPNGTRKFTMLYTQNFRCR